MFGDEREFGEELVEGVEMEEVLGGEGVVERLVMKLPFGFIGGGVGEKLVGDELGEGEEARVRLLSSTHKEGFYHFFMLSI